MTPEKIFSNRRLIIQVRGILLPAALIVGAALAGVCEATAQTRRPATPQELYGGIEIGAKGIKSLVLRVINEDEGYNVTILNAEVINTTLVQTRDGKFTQQAIRDTGQVVQRFYQRMQQEFRVPADQINVIGNSGLIGDNPQDIADEVKRRIGVEIDFLDIETEVQLTIAGTIPRRYRVGRTWYDNRSVSVMVDVGSGNTKGGYQQLRQVAIGRPDYDYVSWGMPIGTVTFTNEVNKLAGGDADLQSFIKRSQELSVSLLRPTIRNEVSRKPGLLNRKKIYVSGGVVWSMVTLLHPEDRRSYIPVTLNDINTFYARMTTDPDSLLNPDLSGIRNPTVREEAQREIESVRNTFTTKNLIAGAEVLKAVANELGFPGKTLIFARFGYLSWVLNYVRLQAEQ
ncbi:MAG: hypothetical protein IPM66_04545 [Acidobacteriota bacterium]|nr:MAG: hypothetical protein IPM66_04545 [Acidobacteriota bacterium]